MQLATVYDGTPWVCSVYYVTDKAGNVYWLSYPDRRHSQELTANPQVAVTVAVKQDMPVIGVQAEGTARAVTDIKTIAKVLPLYIAKYGVGRQFVQKFLEGKNRHVLYVFAPKRCVLFDEQTFGQDNAQEILL